MNGDVLAKLWDVVLWGLGLCATGFFALAGWLWWVVIRLNDKASYSWIENQLTASVNKKMNDMQETLNQIKNAIVGDFNQRGLIAKHDDMVRDIADIKTNCEKVHAERNK